MCLSVIVTDHGLETRSQIAGYAAKMAAAAINAVMAHRSLVECSLVVRSWRADTARKRRCKLRKRCSGLEPGRTGLGGGRYDIG